MKRGFDELEKSRIFISSTIKDLKEHNEGVRGQIQQIEENISNLGSNDYRVEVKLDELEQYARRDCLEITGIPVVPNDDLALLVRETSDLDVNDISIAHCP